MLKKSTRVTFACFQAPGYIFRYTKLLVFLIITVGNVASESLPQIHSSTFSQIRIGVWLNLPQLFFTIIHCMATLCRQVCSMINVTSMSSPLLSTRLRYGRLCNRNVPRDMTINFELDVDWTYKVHLKISILFLVSYHCHVLPKIIKTVEIY